MKFQAEPAPFLAAAQFAGSVARNKFIPVLECVQITADAGLAIRGTDMDRHHRAICDASVSIKGTAAVHAATLTRWLAAAQGLVTAEMDGSALRLRSGRSAISLPSLHGEAFPLWPQIEGEEVIGAPEAMRLCHPFADAGGSATPHLAGVYFDGQSAVASQRAILCATPAPGGKGIVPIGDVQALLSGMKAGFRLFIGDHGYRAEAEGRQVAGKLLENRWPDWRALVVGRNVLGEADADALLAAIDAASLGDAREVRLTSDGATITAEGVAFSLYGTQATAEAAQDGGEAWGGLFNAKFIATTLKALSGSVVSIEKAGQGFLFAPKAGDHFAVCFGLRDSQRAAA